MDDTRDVAVLWLALEPDTPADAARLDDALKQLASEDPRLRARSGEAGQIFVAGASEDHLESVLDRLRREFKVDANVGKLQIAYRETLTAPAVGQGRFIRTTAGRGQYGHVRVRVSPLPAGRGCQFSNQIVGGAIPDRYIAPIEEGIHHALARGVIAGCPVDDVKVELVDGSFHETDSSDTAFKVAAVMAFADAAKKARPILTEPIMRMEVSVPEPCLGDVTKDLRDRHIQIHTREARGETHLLRTRVALRRVIGYGPHLHYLTGGRGSHVLVLDRFEPVSHDPHGGGGEPDAPVGAPRKPPPYARGAGTGIPEPDDDEG